jgi:O-antigen ligase
MPPHLATVVFIILILALFWLDRDPEARTSMALWVPTVWLLINASRPVSLWLAAFGFNVGTEISQADQYLEGSPIDRNVFAVLLAAGLIVLASRRRQVGSLLRRNVPILLFFSYCLLSILWSDYPFITLKHWIKGVGDVVMVSVVLTESEPEAALKRILRPASFLLIPLSVLFIKYYPDLGRGYRAWTWTPMYSGVTMGKNLLGMTCLICGLGSLWSFLAAYRDRNGRERRRRLIAHGTVLLMVFWLFWIANSMTSLSCFVMAGGLMVITSLSRSARNPGVAHFLVAAVICVPLFALFSGMGGGMVESLGRDPTFTGRTAIWKVVLSLSGNPLVGTGYESFWLSERLLRIGELTMKGLQEAHNGYLEVYLNLGWIGVTLLAVLIVTGYRNVVFTLRRNPHAGGIRLALFVVTLVFSLTEAGFRMMAPVWITFLLATTALPEAANAEVSAALSIEHGPNFAEPQPQSHHVFDSSFPQEGF